MPSSVGGAVMVSSYFPKPLKVLPTSGLAELWGGGQAPAEIISAGPQELSAMIPEWSLLLQPGLSYVEALGLFCSPHPIRSSPVSPIGFVVGHWR